MNLPILHAGGIGDIATANFALAEGHVDLVGMTRAQIADPYLVAKLERGEEDRIRPCVGLGYCVDRVNQGKAAVCGQNAAMGREAVLPHVIGEAVVRKRVVVVGGGPGGMEAGAGFSVAGDMTWCCWKRQTDLAGNCNWRQRDVFGGRFGGVADWLIGEVEAMGVDVRLNTYAEAGDVLALRPDVVIVATGGWPALADDLATSSWDVLAGSARVTGDVLLFDELGDHAGAVVADAMAQAGCSVEVVTPDRALMHDLGPTTSAVALRELSCAGVRFTCLSELCAIERDGNKLKVLVRNVLTGEDETRFVDHVVVERGAVAMDDVYHALKAQSANAGQLNHAALIAGELPFDPPANGEFVLARIGDAVTSRNMHASILDALRVCHKL